MNASEFMENEAEARESLTGFPLYCPNGHFGHMVMDGICTVCGDPGVDREKFLVANAQFSEQ